MRVALVGPTYPYKGGIVHHTTELGHRLAAAGHEVDLVSWSSQYPTILYPGRQRLDCVEGTPYPRTTYTLTWWRPDSWWQVGQQLAQDRYDLAILVVVTPVQAPAYLGILTAFRRAKRCTQPRLVALCHNVLPHETRPGDVRLVRAVLRRTDSVLVHSPAQAELARRLANRPTYVADLPPHPPGEPSLARPVSDRISRHLLFFGIVRPYKGLDVLLRALAQVPDVSLTVAGEFWGGTESSQQLIRSLGLSDRVHLRPGYVPAAHLAQLFGNADAVVLPYRSGTATQNVWLAFAHGVPVVASDVGTIGQQVRDRVDGLLVPPGDVDALARVLCQLYADSSLLNRLRAAVRAADPDILWTSYLRTLQMVAEVRPGNSDDKQR